MTRHILFLNVNFISNSECQIQDLTIYNFVQLPQLCMAIVWPSNDTPKDRILSLITLEILS